MTVPDGNTNFLGVTMLSLRLQSLIFTALALVLNNSTQSGKIPSFCTAVALLAITSLMTTCADASEPDSRTEKITPPCTGAKKARKAGVKREITHILYYNLALLPNRNYRRSGSQIQNFQFATALWSHRQSSPATVQRYFHHG